MQVKSALTPVESRDASPSRKARKSAANGERWKTHFNHGGALFYGVTLTLCGSLTAMGRWLAK